VLNKNVLPNNLDSLAYVTTSGDASTAALLPDGSGSDGDILGIEDVAVGAMITDVDGIMADIGMTELRYVDSTDTNLPADVASGGCNPVGGVLQETVASRSNAMVAGNIFNGPDGNGCGQSITLSSAAIVAYWTGSVERILGPGEYGSAVFSGSAMSGTATENGASAPILLAVGFGPASNLFNTQELGGLTSVPVYRHVNPDQYNRFIGLFHVADATCASDSTDFSGATIAATDQVAYVGCVDGAGDTKEEELGEWDGTRNTI
jgi:hypothetical protein